MVFWLPGRALENMFWQKALLTQVISQPMQSCRVACYSRHVPNMNWKYSSMQGATSQYKTNFWRWDSEWNPALQTTGEMLNSALCRSLEDSSSLCCSVALCFVLLCGELFATLYCCVYSAQDGSWMSIEFTVILFNMFAWILNRKPCSKVNSTIRMFNSSMAVFKVNFEKVSSGTILF